VGREYVYRTSWTRRRSNFSQSKNVRWVAIGANSANGRFEESFFEPFLLPFVFAFDHEFV
jgi:hypothetical protein